MGVSWTLWGLVAATGRSIADDLTVGLAYVLGGFGPALAGIIMTHRDRSAGPDLWARLFQLRRIRPGWWPVVLFLFPLTFLLAHVLVGLVEPGASVWPSFSEGPGKPVAYVLLNGLYIAVVGPLSEEPGWRGYALDRLQARYSPLVASIAVGFLWWAWHLPLLAVPGSFLFEAGTSLAFLAGYLGTVLLYSILFTWVYNHNERSVLAATVMHFSINLTTALLAPAFEVFAVATALLLVLAGIVVASARMWTPNRPVAG